MFWFLESPGKAERIPRPWLLKGLHHHSLCWTISVSFQKGPRADWDPTEVQAESCSKSARPCVSSVSWEMLVLDLHGTSTPPSYSNSPWLLRFPFQCGHGSCPFSAFWNARSQHSARQQHGDTSLIWDSHGVVLLPTLSLSFKMGTLDFGYVWQPPGGGFEKTINVRFHPWPIRLALEVGPRHP